MSAEVDSLIEVMARLRNPDGGCPWDLEQDFKSLARYTLEEAYEVVEAIEQDDMPHLTEELGDLLLQIVFQAQIAKERGLFTLDDIAKGEAEKMIDRHPHVFGDRDSVKTAKDVLKNWEADKAAKREQASDEPVSVLDDIATALPATLRATKLQARAARIGFDWPSARAVFDKVREEMAELEVEIQAAEKTPPTDAAAKAKAHDLMEGELGDVLFVLANLARKLDLDPERALRKTNRKFESRFRFIENALTAKGQSVQAATLEEMEALWLEAKKRETA